MAREIINVGSAPNDGTGDPIRQAYIKCNNNFQELYARAQTSPPTTLVGKENDVAGMYAYDSTTFYFCYANYDGTSEIWQDIPGLDITGLANGSSNLQVLENSDITFATGGQSNVVVIGSTTTVANLTVSGATITGNVLPAANVTYSLGSADMRWSNLYLSGNTIFLGNAQISADASDVRFIAPDGSEFSVGGSGNGNATGSFGTVVASGNITANQFFGDGQFLTNITTFSNVAVNQIANATSTMSIDGPGAPVTVTIAGTSNVAVFDTQGLTVDNDITAGGNVTAGNVTATEMSGNVVASFVSVTEILKTGSNGVGNIGNSTSTFDTVFAMATSSGFGDIAELYQGDQAYPVGTVVSFGGDKEVTISDFDQDPAVAGVVSDSPCLIMNNTLHGDNAVKVALLGRVSCMVQGPVKKGQLMVASGQGRARAESHPRPGAVIGKSLENFDGNFGTIEISVGRF